MMFKSKRAKFFFFLGLSIVVTLLDGYVDSNYHLADFMWYRGIRLFIIFPLWVYTLTVLLPLEPKSHK